MWFQLSAKQGRDSAEQDLVIYAEQCRSYRTFDYRRDRSLAIKTSGEFNGRLRHSGTRRSSILRLTNVIAIFTDTVRAHINDKL